MLDHRFRIAAIVLTALSCGLAAADDPVSFSDRIAPILLDNCLACHSAKKAEGGYRVDTFDELLKAGDSGIDPVASGEADGGELLRRLNSTDPAERMPAGKEPLSNEQIDAIRRWIAAGAAFDGDKGDTPLHLVMPPRQYADPPDVYPQSIPVTAMAFSPDGQQLLVGGYHELLVWNIADATAPRRIKNLPQRIFALEFLPDGRRLAVAGGEPGRNGEVRVVNFESGAITAVVGRTTDVVLDVAVRPGTGELAVAGADSLIRIVDPFAGSERVIASHADGVNAVAWSDDGTLLASASRDKSAKLFRGDSGELLVNYQGHAAIVRGVAFMPDGKQVLSTGADGKLHRWSVEGGGKTAELAVGGDQFRITRGTGYVLVPGTDGHLRQIDLAANTVTQALAGHRDWAVSAAVTKDGSRFASGSLDGEVHLWNADGTLHRSWSARP